MVNSAFSSPSPVDYKEIFEGSPGLFLLLLPDAPTFTIINASNEYLQAISVTSQDIIGHGVFEVFPANLDDPANAGVLYFRESLDYVLQHKQKHTMPVLKYDTPARKPGMAQSAIFLERYWSSVNMPILGKDGEVRYIIHCTEDVTDFLIHTHQDYAQPSASSIEAELYTRVQEISHLNTELSKATSNLQKSEERMSLMMEAAQLVGIWDWDIIRDVIVANTRFAKLYHIDESLAESGAPLSAYVQHIPREDLAQIETVLQEAMQRGGKFSVQHRIKQEDGSVCWVQAYGRCYLNEQGQAIRTAGINIDITNEKLAMEELQAARNSAEAANLAKSEFLANMSHEIRTPMSSIIGNTELLNATALSREQHEYVHTIAQAGDMLLGLIDDILDLSKIEAGEMELSLSTCTLKETLKEIICVFKERAAKSGTKLYIEQLDTMDTPLLCDTKRLKQVLVNLIGNAVKFTKGGHIAVSVTKTRESIDSITLLFTIEDTGIGIAPEKQQNIFDKFIQAESFTNRRYGGTGLGLAISKQLVELMGGKIGVESALSKGSRFWFEITLNYDKQPITDTVNIDKSAQPPDIPKQPFRLTPQFDSRVLVAEDYPPNQVMIKKMLEKMGCSVAIASTGEEVIAMLRQSHYDLVFMDVQMPEMDGFEATRFIRQDTALRDTIIIAMTANALEGDKKRCIDAGMDDYIPKPVRSQEMARMIEAYSKILTPSH